MIETVIFDMDGLLIDSEPLWDEAIAEVFARMNVVLRPEDYAQTRGLRISEVVEYWHHHFEWEGRPVEQVTEEVMEAVTRKILNKGKMLDGASYILDFFKKKKFKIGLASSSPMSLIQAVLEHFKLGDYFDTLHSGQHQDFGKPHPSVYLSCARELDAIPFQCLVFEDSITGLIAAKAARMKVVAVPERRNRADPRYALADLKLESLSQFSEKSLHLIEN